MARWSDTVENLRRIESRRVYLELMVEKHGDSAGGDKMREAAAIQWVLDVLADRTELADDVRDAREIVARNPPRLSHDSR